MSGRGYLGRDRSEPEGDKFGLSVVGVDGHRFDAGDHEIRFALQSISKVFAYALALADNGRDAVLRRVGVEPSGDAFNSITFDEHNRRPYNPMVNAGALAPTNLLRGANLEEKLERILELVRAYNCPRSFAPTVKPLGSPSPPRPPMRTSRAYVPRTAEQERRTRFLRLWSVISCATVGAPPAARASRRPSRHG